MNYWNRPPQLSNLYLFLDALAQEKYIQEVSLRLDEVLYAFLQLESLKSGPKNVESVNRPTAVYSSATV